MTDSKKTTFSLLKKYQALLIENDRLKAENERLRLELAALEDVSKKSGEAKSPGAASDKKVANTADVTSERVRHEPTSTVYQNSKSDEKIKLFASLFRGNSDYQPFCHEMESRTNSSATEGCRQQGRKGDHHNETEWRFQGERALGSGSCL